MRTKRLILNAPRAIDQTFLDTLGAQQSVQEFLGTGGLGNVEGLRSDWHRNGFGIFVARRVTDEEPIGVYGLVASTAKEGCRELVCSTRVANRRQGLAVEACRAVLSWAKAQDLVPVHGRVEAHNEKSPGLVQKLEMRPQESASSGDQWYVWP